jgi:hypothetical protein
LSDLELLVSSNKQSFVMIEVSTRVLTRKQIEFEDIHLHFDCKLPPPQVCWPVKGCEVWVSQRCIYDNRQTIVDELMKSGAKWVWWIDMIQDTSYFFDND